MHIFDRNVLIYILCLISQNLRNDIQIKQFHFLLRTSTQVYSGRKHCNAAIRCIYGLSHVLHGVCSLNTQIFTQLPKDERAADMQICKIVAWLLLEFAHNSCGHPTTHKILQGCRANTLPSHRSPRDNQRD